MTTPTDVTTAADAALASGYMTGNDEYQPTHYIVNAENVHNLVAVVLGAVSDGDGV
jgi:hypothetical protein